MNIHVKLTGEAANVVEELIKRGYAANKTEAIRHAVIECKENHLDQDEGSIRTLSTYANRDIWEDEKEDKVWVKYLKKKKKIDLLGITKGKLGPWIEEEDRLDVRE